MSVEQAKCSRWWRLQSDRRLTVEVTMLDGGVALTVIRVGSIGAQSLCAVEARYYGVDRPEFGGIGQIQRVARHFQLDVLTDAVLAASWIPLTAVGVTTHPPDAYGPGATLAVWHPPRFGGSRLDDWIDPKTRPSNRN